MLLRAVLLVALVACSSRNAPPPEPTTRYPIVPDAVLSQLGEIGFALAIDLRLLHGPAVESLIPDSFRCARDILRKANIAVVTKGTETWEGRITGVAQTPAAECAATIANTFGIAVTHTARASDELLITERGARARAGNPPGVITDLLGRVPANVSSWLVTSGIPAHKIKSAVAWLTATPTTWKINVTADSTELAAAKPWLESIVRGFTSVAEAAQIPVEATWFAIEATPTTAKLVATIPLAAFVPTTR